nr:MAG TPA: hypothetical protein [Caudoviricetes sp.]
MIRIIRNIFFRFHFYIFIRKEIQILKFCILLSRKKTWR